MQKTGASLCSASNASQKVQPNGSSDNQFDSLGEVYVATAENEELLHLITSNLEAEEGQTSAPT